MSRLWMVAFFISLYPLLETAPTSQARQPNPLGGVTLPTASRAKASSNAPRAVGKTTFEGRVVSTKRGKFPETQLVLDLYQVGSSSLLRGRGNRSRLPVKVRAFRNSKNVISMADPRNVNLTGAYYLLPGDPVKGTIRFADGEWQLVALARTPSLSPPKVASLKVELSTDKQSYVLGEDVRITLTVTNTGTGPAVFNFKNGQRYEFVVKEDGRDVWRWSSDRFFTQSLSTVTLSPGESLSFREGWPGVDNGGSPVDPGNYTVVGWITATGQAEFTESSAEIQLKESRSSGPSIRELIRTPRSFLNREITLEGAFRGQLAERGERLVEGGPPTSRNDWILRDETGSIYVAGNGGLVIDREDDLNRRMRVHGLVRMNPEGRLYLRAWEVERLGADRRH